MNQLLPVCLLAPLLRRRPAPQLPVALSDGIRWDLTPAVVRERNVLYAGDANATVGSSMVFFVPVMQLQ